MKHILVTAYAINPCKGSEDGMGWNFLLQIARNYRVTAITRVNNREPIFRYMAEHPEEAEWYERINFRWFDWPRWMLFWKKGPILSVGYYYAWQLTLAIWLLPKKLHPDLVHNLNFHNDWTPSFLWLLRKPLVWGPVGHHPAIPADFLIPVYGKGAWRKDRTLWLLKQFFWKFDPWLRITIRRAGRIICMNSAAARRLHLSRDKWALIPSVAVEGSALPAVAEKPAAPPDPSGAFTVLSIGRFVPLKGFDLTIRSFARFYHSIAEDSQHLLRLLLVGSGPVRPLLEKMIQDAGISGCTELIAWMPRQELLALYPASSVFLFPSHEGAGMVVAEAMRAGLPVIALDNSGPGEFLHPDTSLRVPLTTYDATVDGLAACLRSLFLDKALYRTEQQLSLDRFRNSFRWDLRAVQLQQIYESVWQEEMKRKRKAGSKETALQSPIPKTGR